MLSYTFSYVYISTNDTSTKEVFQLGYKPCWQSICLASVANWIWQDETFPSQRYLSTTAPKEEPFFRELAAKLGHKLGGKWCPSGPVSLAPLTISDRNERWKVPGWPLTDLMRSTDGRPALITFFTLAGLNIHLPHLSNDGTLMITTIPLLKQSPLIIAPPPWH